MFQLDLFQTPEESEFSEMRKNYNKLHTSVEKVRKGTYAEINSLKKVCGELATRQEIIERHICRNN